MLPRTSSIWRRDSHPMASGKPGGVQSAFGILLALTLGWWYQTIAGCALCAVFTCRLILHVRDVRLGKKLKLDPELARLYYGRAR